MTDSQWLVVEGAPRSGTTFLNALVNSHPRAALFTESNLRELFAKLEDLLAFGFTLADEQLVRISEVGVPLPARLEQLSRAFFEIQFGKTLSVIGVKIPNFAPELRALYREKMGDFKQISIVRRPSRVVASSLQRRANARMGLDSWHVASVEDAIVEWAVNWENTARALNTNDIFLTSYDSFIENSAREIVRIANYLGLNYNGFSHGFRVTDCQYRLTEEEQAIFDAVLGDIDREVAEDYAACLLDRPEIHLDLRPGEVVALNSLNPMSRLFLKQGFSDLEPWGVWTCGNDAVLAFRSGAPAGAVFALELRFDVFLGERPAFDLIVGLNDAAPTRVTYAGSGTYAATFMVVQSVTGITRVTLHMPIVKAPAEAPQDEVRPLGIGLVSLEARFVGTPVVSCVAPDVVADAACREAELTT